MLPCMGVVLKHCHHFARRSADSSQNIMVVQGSFRTAGLLFACLAASAGGTRAEPVPAAPEHAKVTQDAAKLGTLIAPGAPLRKLAGGLKFTEGPVWLPFGGGCLIFSDIPGDELKQWSAAGGLKSFRHPSHHANGNAIDRAGRLITCEHGGRRVSILEKDGSVRTLIDRYEGKRLNSPNDVIVKSDGTIWFTDPPYGLPPNEAKEVEGNYVYCFDPGTGDLKVVARDFDMPNGLCFSPDEEKLYVSDSGQSRQVRVFAVQSDHTLRGGAEFCRIEAGVPDGIRCDARGDVYVSAADGIHIFGPDGGMIGRVLVPETTTNLCFGGADGKTIFITAGTSIYSIQVLVPGR
ncbi:MAG: Gluconolactonase [Verrucomicrobia bacterium]|nr:Gluconolactonase [Verrucomicrobiota bacterium]